MKRRSPLRWAIPAGALASAAILWVAFQPARQAPHQTVPTIEVAQNKETSSEYSAHSAVRREEDERAQRATRGDLDQLAKAVPQVSTDLKSAAPPQTHPRSAEGSGFGAGSAAAPAANAKGVSQEKKADEAASFSDARDEAAQAPTIETDSAKITRTDQLEARASGAAKPAAPPPPAPAVVGAAGQVAGGAAAKQRAKAETKDAVTTEAAAANQMAQAPIGGRSYQAMTLSPGVARAPRVIAVAGSNHAWRVGEQGKIEFTSNGGKDWKEQASGVSASLTSGSAPSKKVCWIAGRNGVLLVTTDAGQHWRQVTTPIAGDIGNVTAMDARHARIRDAGNRDGYETNDGGKTWSPVVIE